MTKMLKHTLVKNWKRKTNKLKSEKIIIDLLVFETGKCVEKIVE